MPRISLAFAGPEFSARSPNANDQITQNFYPQREHRGAHSAVSLYPTPGLKRLAVVGTGPCRGNGERFKGDAYFVSGNQFFKIDHNNVTTVYGTINTTSGRVYFAKNTSQLMFVDGSDGWIFDGTTLTQITDPDFPANPTTVTMLDGYFIVNDSGTGSFYISALRDGLSWSAADSAVAEANPDSLKNLIATKKDLYLFGDITTEVYYNSGNADFPFEPYQGGVIEWGIRAPDSLVRMDNTLYWLGQNEEGGNMVLRATGLSAQIVSDSDINWQLSQLSKTDDAVAFAYQQGGHTFYELSFPTAQKTFVYDVGEQMWHTRSSKNDGRHRAEGHVYFNNKNLVGSYSDGDIYELDPDTYTDDGDAITRVRRAAVIGKDRNRLFHYRLEVDFEFGTGLVTGQGQDPQAMLRWSDDGGHTWSNEVWRSIGKIGEYSHRAVWPNLGQAYYRIYELTVTDPVKVVIVDAHLDVEEGAF